MRLLEQRDAAAVTLAAVATLIASLTEAAAR